MTNETYQSTEQLKEEIRGYALLGIDFIGTYERARNDTKARKELISLLKSALENITQENPNLPKIPVVFNPETPKQIQIKPQ